MVPHEKIGAAGAAFDDVFGHILVHRLAMRAIDTPFQAAGMGEEDLALAQPGRPRRLQQRLRREEGWKAAERVRTLAQIPALGRSLLRLSVTSSISTFQNTSITLFVTRIRI